ncbi:MAG: CHAT domain-containing protein [Acidobacteria bacterium]|nr:CHAT domain-containing protein [Acidobacteriota bacterium]
MIAQAYTERRPFDLRIAGAAYGPVRLEKRGLESSFHRPSSLLEAEAAIARKLESNPNNAEWLALRARAEMLAWNGEAAIGTLNHALEQKADDPNLLADFGMAYALRAEAENRPIDYGTAIEYLSRALKARPVFAEAVFNRALVYEIMFLYEEATREWQRYLDLDTGGGWADEARHRLKGLEQKKETRQAALASISSDPMKLLERVRAEEEVEPEPYLDIALIDWLPRQDDASTQKALHTLARLFQTRHHDVWLRDVLASGDGDQSISGFSLLASAVRANRARETEKALSAASQAASVLASAGNPAAALRAKAERVYGLNRAQRAKECVDEALATEREARRLKYQWILGQVTIDLGTCRGMHGNRGGAEYEMQRAVEVTREGGYPILDLRATSILAGTRTDAGNLLVAWDQARDGLSRFWSGPFPAIRAHQIYFNLARAAESLGWLQAAYLFGRAAVEAIAEGPDRLTDATSRYRVAHWTQLAGWPRQAATEYERAATLFGGIEQTKPVRELRLYAELFRAQAEIAAGAVDDAMHRLDNLGGQVAGLEYELARMRYHETVGEAYWRTGQTGEAKAAYGVAVELSERRLDSFQDFEQRSASIEAIGKAYRGLVELHWSRDGDPAAALRVWETFRAGEWPRRDSELDLPQRVAALRKETFISYAVLPDGMVMWVFDDSGIEGVRLAVRPEQLQGIAERFARLCADPASNNAALERDGRQLYQWLVAPLAHRLDPNRVLVIEPDGAVAAIPMQALIDGDARYLGERFAIVIARGLVDYQHRSASPRVTASSRMLVVANPALDKQTARAFPPLAATMREAASVAARFPRPVMLAGKNATLAALERHRTEAEVFHFTGHGFSNAGNGGLLLAPGEEGAMGAESLDGRRLAGKNWTRCRLVVLSACSSGTGETTGPVNPESLVRRLLWAGVARVVASRWNADSETGVRLMEEFYDGLLAGLDVPVALQQSAERTRRQTVSKHPYYWAGFQSFGSR